MGKQYLVGIDVGTSGLKAIITDAGGAVIASCTEEYPLYTPRPGWSEQCPEDWWAAAIRALSAVVAAAGVQPGDIKGLGLSGQMHGMVALDRDMNVIRPAILWNDQRTEAECERVRTAAGGLEGLLALTNNNMLPGYTGGKILWLKRNEPQHYERARMFLNPKDYISFLLTGECSTEVSDASGTGLFNVRERRWSRALLDKLGIDAALMPCVTESSDVVGHVSPDAAKATGLPAGLPVVGGGGDAVIQTTGQGLVSPGVLGVVIGTSGVVAMGLDGFKPNDGSLQVFCNNAPHLWHAMGVTLAAGGSMRWFRDVFARDVVREAKVTGRSPYDCITDEAETSKPGAKGLMFLPYLSGERCPYSDPDARGAFLGLNLTHTFGDAARAVMEGVTYSLRQVSDLIFQMDTAMRRERVVLSGGGAASALWRSIVADTFEMPVQTVSGAAEGGAYGAALVAGVGVGVYGNINEAVSVLKVETETLPDAGRSGAYKEMYGVYREAYHALKPLNDKLARL